MFRKDGGGGLIVCKVKTDAVVEEGSFESHLERCCRFRFEVGIVQCVGQAITRCCAIHVGVLRVG